jgi:hypothetical protein
MNTHYRNGATQSRSSLDWNGKLCDIIEKLDKPMDTEEYRRVKLQVLAIGEHTKRTAVQLLYEEKAEQQRIGRRMPLLEMYADPAEPINIEN